LDRERQKIPPLDGLLTKGLRSNALAGPGPATQQDVGEFPIRILDEYWLVVLVEAEEQALLRVVGLPGIEELFISRDEFMDFPDVRFFIALQG